MRGKRSDIIPLLEAVQAKFGYLPEEAMRQVARFTRVPVSQVYGVATFYALFRLTPGGKHIVRLCRGTACHVQGGAQVLSAIQDKLGITPGATTPDGNFTLEIVSCIGACALAPNMTIGNEVFSQLTPQKAADILDKKARE